MAFRMMGDGIDGSDMCMWAMNPCATAFIKELEIRIDTGIRDLLKKPCPEHAEKVKAYQKVVGLFEEAQKMG